MSVSNLFSKNSYKIYVDDITLKNLNLSSDGNYKIKFPAVVPSGIAPLSVLGVDTINGDIISLKWLEPSESLPFDVINCNILNAEEEINCPEGITTLGYMECNICNIKKSGGTEITGFLTSPLQIENNIAYFLPPSRPTQDGQVLSSQINGTMSWVNNNISNFIPKAYVQEYQGIIVLDRDTQFTSLNFTFNLVEGEYYTGAFLGRATKINPTGDIRFRSSVDDISSSNVSIRPSNAISSGWTFLTNPAEIDVGLNINFWFQATATGNNRINCRLDTDITQQGQVGIDMISIVITRIAV